MTYFITRGLKANGPFAGLTKETWHDKETPIKANKLWFKIKSKLRISFDGNVLEELLKPSDRGLEALEWKLKDEIGLKNFH